MDLYIPKETLDILSYKSTLGRSLKQKRFKLLINVYRRLVSGIQGCKRDISEGNKRYTNKRYNFPYYTP